jgi:hypothetical protein
MRTTTVRSSAGTPFVEARSFSTVPEKMRLERRVRSGIDSCAAREREARIKAADAAIPRDNRSSMANLRQIVTGRRETFQHRSMAEL